MPKYNWEDFEELEEEVFQETIRTKTKPKRKKKSYRELQEKKRKNEQINNFFTIEMIYLWLNLGVLPFWIILFFFPHSFMSKYLVRSIFPFMIFSFVYVYLLYYFFVSDFNFQNNFTLYLSLENLSDLFSENGFLIMFWCHFLAVNLFCGAWIVSDSIKLSISKFLTFFPLLITYFIGPLGLFIYWLIRIFFARRMSLYD